MFKYNAKNLFFCIVILIFFSSCSYFKKEKINESEKNKEDQTLIKKKKIETDLKKRSEKNVGTLFDSSRLKKNNNNFEFSTSNPLWRATIESFDGIPLQTVSYSGGVIVTDWWAKKNGGESIKIQVNFVSNELKTSSLRISSFKKNCSENKQCNITSLSKNFNDKVKKNIFDKARNLKIKDEENKLKK